MLLMRALILAISFVFTACGGERLEVVATDGKWQLIRSVRSEHSGRPQYYYDLKYDGRSVAVAGDLSTPLGKFTMAAPTDRFSDSGWLVDEPSPVRMPTTPPAVTPEELRRGYYVIHDRYRRQGTPSTWVFQWLEPGRGVWMHPEKLFDPGIAATKPPQVAN
jgi:hypothetical protein